MDTLVSAQAERMGVSPGAFSILLILLAALLLAGHALHFSPASKFLSQGALALLAGLGAGGCLYLYFEGIKKTRIPSTFVAFQYDVYMDLFLPPIIFYAGFSIKKKHFFENIGALMSLGVLGTAVNAALLAVAAEVGLRVFGLAAHERVGNALALGALFAATDSVAALSALDAATYPGLHALVFGEAVTNDATAIVLLKALQPIRTEAQLTTVVLARMVGEFCKLATMSLALGLGVGLVCSFLLKHAFAKRHSTDRELCLLATLGFLSYIFAESLGLSGVFSSFFCGITMSHYSFYSLSPTSKVVSIYAFRALSFLAEVLLFLSSGLDLWSMSLWHKELYTKREMLRQTVGLALWLFFAVPLTRVIVVVPLSLAINVFRKGNMRLDPRNIAALCWAGCGRGAVTLALAFYHFVGNGAASDTEKAASLENHIICAACMVAIVLSTVVIGGATATVLDNLLCKRHADVDSGSNGRHQLLYKDASKPANSNIHGGARMAQGVVPELGLGHNTQDITYILPRPSSEGYAPLPRHPDNQDRQGHPNAPSFLHDAWHRLDRSVLQPVFGGRTAAAPFPLSMSAYRSPPTSPAISPRARAAAQPQMASSRYLEAQRGSGINAEIATQHLQDFGEGEQFERRLTHTQTATTTTPEVGSLRARFTLSRTREAFDEAIEGLLFAQPGEDEEQEDLVDQEVVWAQGPRRVDM